MADEMVAGGENGQLTDIEPVAPEETPEERLAREEAEAKAAAEEAARLAAEAEHAALVESQKPEAIRLLTAIRAGVPAEAGVECEDVAAAFAALDPATCGWADAELNERARLALAETQKEQAFRCWHHVMTSARPRDDVRQHMLLLEPEAFAYGKEKIEAEMAVLAKQKADAEAAGFSVPMTAAEVAELAVPRRRSTGRGR